MSRVPWIVQMTCDHFSLCTIYQQLIKVASSSTVDLESHNGQFQSWDVETVSVIWS